MKLRFLILVLVPSLALAVRGADEKAAAAPVPGAHAQKDTTELGDHMGKIGRAFRAITKSVKDPAKNADSLKQIAIVRANAEAALELKPAKLADIPADRQAKFLDDYHADMKHLLADVASLEAALEAGNNAAASTIVKKMKADMDDSHKQFRKKKPDDM